MISREETNTAILPRRTLARHAHDEFLDLGGVAQLEEAGQAS